MDSPHLEPWLRQTHTSLPVVIRAVCHALEQAQEDIEIWCSGFDVEELNLSFEGIPSVAFQLRHIARSLDRLFSYAEGKPLSEGQLKALETEREKAESKGAVLEEFRRTMDCSFPRLIAFCKANLESARSIGRSAIPVTLGDILIHIAEHTQRHVGQAITTAKLVRAQRSEASRVLR